MLRLLALMMFGCPMLLGDHLTIISPHRKSLQQEFIGLFKVHYKNVYKQKVQVDWIDQGGTENCLRYVIASPQSEIDVFWGGGDLTFVDLHQKGLVQPLNLSKKTTQEIPPDILGIKLYNEPKTWIATALSSFGIMFNKPLLKIRALTEPKSWQDLADPKLYNMLSIADPRHSSTSLVMFILMLKSLGWEEGWKTLTAMAGNVKIFAHSSSDPLKAVINGDVAVATTVDYYALAKIGQLGADRVGYTMPSGQTILNSDPVAILKGSKNAVVARRFIEFLLAKDTQQLLISKVGSLGGPQFTTLARMAVNPESYKQVKADDLVSVNPFIMQQPMLSIDFVKYSQVKTLLSDLLGAMLIDPHVALKGAWQQIRLHKNVQARLQHLAQPPVTEAEFWKYAEKWHDQLFRNRMINSWATHAIRRYTSIPQAHNLSG